MQKILEEIQSKIDNPNYLINSIEKGQSGAYITLGVENAELVLWELSRLQSENDELRKRLTNPELLEKIEQLKIDLSDKKIRELNPIWVRNEIIKRLTNK